MEGADKRKAESVSDDVKHVRPCKCVREFAVDDEDEVEDDGDEDSEKEEAEAEYEADDKEKDRKSVCSEEGIIEQEQSPKLPVPPTVVVKQAIEYRIAPAPADTYPPDLRCNGCDQQNFIAGLSS